MYIAISHVNLDMDVESLASEKDEQKENIPLRRKPRKAVSTPTSSQLKTLLFSPNEKQTEKMGHAKSTPVTPKKVGGSERVGMVTLG
jgi:hypothetical protein